MSSKQFLLPILALALFTASPAPADLPAPAAVPAPTASVGALASAGALPSASAPPPPTAVYFVGPPPAEKSKAPTVAEWAASENVTLAHSSTDCTTARVREWFRVRCTVFNALEAQLIAGTHEVYYSFTKNIACYPGTNDYGGENVCEDLVEAVFPLRRGDRRVIEISTQQSGYGMNGGAVERGGEVISEAWPDDEPAPSITIDPVILSATR